MAPVTGEQTDLPRFDARSERALVSLESEPNGSMLVKFAT